MGIKLSQIIQEMLANTSHPVDARHAAVRDLLNQADKGFKTEDGIEDDRLNKDTKQIRTAASIVDHPEDKTSSDKSANTLGMQLAPNSATDFATGISKSVSKVLENARQRNKGLTGVHNYVTAEKEVKAGRDPFNIGQTEADKQTQRNLNPNGIMETLGGLIPDIAIASRAPEIPLEGGAIAKIGKTALEGILQSALLGTAKGDSASDTATNSLITGVSGGLLRGGAEGVKGLANKGLSAIIHSADKGENNPEFLKKALTKLLETKSTSNNPVFKSNLKELPEIAKESGERASTMGAAAANEAGSMPLLDSKHVIKAAERGVEGSRFPSVFTGRQKAKVSQRLNKSAQDIIPDEKQSFGSFRSDLKDFITRIPSRYTKRTTETVKSPIVNEFNTPFITDKVTRTPMVAHTKTAPEDLLGFLDSLDKNPKSVLKGPLAVKSDDFVTNATKLLTDQNPKLGNLLNARKESELMKDLMEKLSAGDPGLKGKAIAASKGVSGMAAGKVPYTASALFTGAPLAVTRGTSKLSDDFIRTILPGLLKTMSASTRQRQDNK